MTLKDYLDQNKLSLKVFGDRCGLSAPTVLRARDGINIPSRRTLQAIVTATGGKVSIQDLISVDDEAAESKTDHQKHEKI
ncbi:helix-turn-helix transcriptional regulator [uncultured Tateyamaria sp.]|uniref:helix-turn-helix domain-containing protein n=1 Tax=uncultured Tateyamaria sp. TaxID=455651 RepID=UPI00261714C1|nr:helix-turn-helix transcriptional regulator [uncultured Tateyamaria sp.]